MSSQPVQGGKSRRGVGTLFVALILVAVIIAAIVLGKNAGGLFGSSAENNVKVVKAVVGSEKMEYFADPAVVERLKELGFRLEATPSGSRKMATRSDLSDFDLAFPSSAPAAEKIAEESHPKGTYTPFHSPMAVATFTPILQALQGQRVAEQRDGTWYINVDEYMKLAASGKRWRDISADFQSPLQVQISSTDIRSSNSAAMYLSIASWIANGGNVPASDAEVRKAVNVASPLFTHQGYTGGSSAGPFSEYLSQGIGSKPMVMIYEAQYLGLQIANKNSLSDDMHIAYLDPTVLSQHTVVALSDNGNELGRLLAEDRTLQELSAKHGFRPSTPGIFDAVLNDQGIKRPPTFLATINPPDYDRLEQLIEGVSEQYSNPNPPEGAPEQ